MFLSFVGLSPRDNGMNHFHSFLDWTVTSYWLSQVTNYGSELIRLCYFILVFLGALSHAYYEGIWLEQKDSILALLSASKGLGFWGHLTDMLLAKSP
jgi:hypothetical protein